MGRSRNAINAFIVAHLFLVALWALPPFYSSRSLRRATATVAGLLGLTQDWPMFAFPRDYDATLSSEILYRDGTTATWDFDLKPPMTFLGSFSSYHHWAYTEALLPHSRQSYLWPRAAMLVERRFFDPARPIQEIRLNISSRDLKDPAATVVTTTFFTTPVTGERP